MAEGMGFEPMSPFSQAKRLAGARTRPLCDPSPTLYMVSNGLSLSNTPAIAGQGFFIVTIVAAPGLQVSHPPKAAPIIQFKPILDRNDY